LRLFGVLKFAIKALTALVDEMIRIGDKTRGGMILILLFLYTAFVMGMVMWIETKGVSDLCNSVGNCTFTMMRLTFYDGNGFDFAYFLTHNHRMLFCITCFYLFLTSFGILNGLVGIFGNVFAAASEDVFGRQGGINDENEDEFFCEEDNNDMESMEGFDSDNRASNQVIIDGNEVLRRHVTYAGGGGGGGGGMMTGKMIHGGVVQPGSSSRKGTSATTESVKPFDVVTAFDNNGNFNSGASKVHPELQSPIGFEGYDTKDTNETPSKNMNDSLEMHPVAANRWKPGAGKNIISTDNIGGAGTEQYAENFSPRENPEVNSPTASNASPTSLAARHRKLTQRSLTYADLKYMQIQAKLLEKKRQAQVEKQLSAKVSAANSSYYRQHQQQFHQQHSSKKHAFFSSPAGAASSAANEAAEAAAAAASTYNSTSAIDDYDGLELGQRVEHEELSGDETVGGGSSMAQGVLSNNNSPRRSAPQEPRRGNFLLLAKGVSKFKMGQGRNVRRASTEEDVQQLKRDLQTLVQLNVGMQKQLSLLINSSSKQMEGGGDNSYIQSGGANTNANHSAASTPYSSAVGMGPGASFSQLSTTSSSAPQGSTAGGAGAAGGAASAMGSAAMSPPLLGNDK
jgi:hypothetical protein